MRLPALAIALLAALAACKPVPASDAATPDMAAHGIATRPFFHQLSSLPAYADAPDARRARDANATSRRLGRFGLNLPSALRLTEDDVDFACTRLLAELG